MERERTKTNKYRRTRAPTEAVKRIVTSLFGIGRRSTPKAAVYFKSVKNLMSGRLSITLCTDSDTTAVMFGYSALCSFEVIHLGMDEANFTLASTGLETSMKRGAMNRLPATFSAYTLHEIAASL